MHAFNEVATLVPSPLKVITTGIRSAGVEGSLAAQGVMENAGIVGTMRNHCHPIPPVRGI
jgi:hypothetical protein